LRAEVLLCNVVGIAGGGEGPVTVTVAVETAQVVEGFGAPPGPVADGTSVSGCLIPPVAEGTSIPDLRPPPLAEALGGRRTVFWGAPLPSPLPMTSMDSQLPDLSVHLYSLPGE
jgi:hypothetical protein